MFPRVFCSRYARCFACAVVALMPALPNSPVAQTVLPPPDLPVVDTSCTWPVLRKSLSVDLNNRLRRELRGSPKLVDLAQRKLFAVGVVDLTDIHRPQVAWINGDVMMYAASLPKIAVLLAAMQSVEEGKLEMTAALYEDMKLMMRKSDNAATTRIIDAIGLKGIARVVTSPRYALFDARKGGGLWVGKRYAKEGKRNPDPLKGLSHAATVSQVCRFYYLLATGRLVSPERSRQMLDIMASPHICHKFVHSLKAYYPLNLVFRKSGTWKTWHSDSILLWSEDGSARYILVALVQHPDGEQILRDLVPTIEKVLGITHPSPPGPTNE